MKKFNSNIIEVSHFEINKNQYVKILELFTSQYIGGSNSPVSCQSNGVL